MKKIEVYDPPMCCSSGVCGPGADMKLINFRAALKELESHGVEVARFNPAQEQAAFAANSKVNKAIERYGMICLPLIVVNGEIVSRGIYPDTAALLTMAGIEPGNPAAS